MGTKLEQFRAHKPRKTNYEKVFCVARREKSSYSVETGIKQREALETHTPSIPFLLLSSSFLSRGIVSNFNLDHIILHISRIYISYTLGNVEIHGYTYSWRLLRNIVHHHEGGRINFCKNIPSMRF